MSVESFLTRELEVRFIDARELTTEAKLNLGITGYCGQEQQQGLIDEAVRIFEQRETNVKDAMRRLKAGLDSAKTLKRASKSCDANGFSSDQTQRSTCETASLSVEDDSQTRKLATSFARVSIWPTRNRSGNATAA